MREARCFCTQRPDNGAARGLRKSIKSAQTAETTSVPEFSTLRGCWGRREQGRGRRGLQGTRAPQPTPRQVGRHLPPERREVLLAFVPHVGKSFRFGALVHRHWQDLQSHVT